MDGEVEGHGYLALRSGPYTPHGPDLGTSSGTERRGHLVWLAN
jgi:hypothetical protein